MGFDSRNVTPELTKAVVHLVSEIRSYKRVETATVRVLKQKVPESTVRRLAKQVGLELAELEESPQRTDGKEVIVPEIAVASCDGGRIRTREPGRGRGVHLSGENGWKETKNASFERMCPHPEQPENEDPCPLLPTTFRTSKRVANIAEKPVPHVEETAETGEDRVVYKGPERILRTAVSSMASSDEFGRMMKREAERRRFDEAPKRAFVGDGLNWNWSVWKKYFSSFVPILDFIHAIQYVFQAAMAMHAEEADGWKTYVKFITLCWSGKVALVIEELRGYCEKQGVLLEQKLPDDDPHKPLQDAIRYLSNNQSRMDYPRYRREGLPVSSAPMESLIKQINFRVKGTEMFWDNPEGAEAILHLRAAALSEDERLDDYLSHRPGYPFVRRPAKPTTAA